MKTAEEMYQYCLKNDFGTGWNEKWALKHFRVIQNAMQTDESAIVCFMGLHNYRSSTQHSNNFAYAITNKRLIYAQQGLMFGQTLQSIALNMLNDISYTSNFSTDYCGVITIKTINTCFNISCGRESGKKILTKINEYLDSRKTCQTVTTSADEILKYKKLLDMGAITQDEFEKKKRQLLDI